MVHGRRKGVTIGDDCLINSSENSNPTAGAIHTHFSLGDYGTLVIGNNAGISQSAITAHEYIQIEDNVLIGAGCMIMDTDFHPIDYLDRLSGKRNISTAPVTIGEGAFYRCPLNHH